MFTGIVQERARVASFDAGRLVVETSLEAELGDSVAVDGVCLTVTANRGGQLAFDVMQETVKSTKPFGDEVNLEAPLQVGDPLGGHYVQGHVDGVGTVRSTGDPVWIDVDGGLLRYVVEKGSIAVDGVSLTVAAVDEAGFAVALIPHTLEVTTLGALEPGKGVNLEVDILAKYVERLLRSKE